MAKRKPLTTARAQAVDKFVACLRAEAPHVDKVLDLNRYVMDYKKGNPLPLGTYVKPCCKKESSSPINGHKAKQSFWSKLLLGGRD